MTDSVQRLVLGWLAALLLGCAGGSSGRAGEAFVPPDEGLFPMGRFVYERNCLVCHGRWGDGDGEMASGMLPKPRKFSTAIFKYRSTPPGFLPTNDDLIRTIRGGRANTSMPYFTQLSDREVRAVVEFIKSFSLKWRKPENYAAPVPLPEPPAWLAAGCTELGPITEAQALSIQTAIAMPGVHATMLLPAGTETWWVYVWPPAGEAQTRLDALRARKLVEEVVLMREGGLRGAIVMGRFKEVANALALQRKLILAGETDVRLAARGGPPATTLLRIQWSSPESLRNAAAAGSGPLVLPASPFSEGLAAQLEQQRDALRAAGSPATLKACPADQATAFSSRR